MSFCSATKGITPHICRLCVCVLINEHSFEPVMCLDLVLDNDDDDDVELNVLGCRLTY